MRNLSIDCSISAGRFSEWFLADNFCHGQMPRRFSLVVTESPGNGSDDTPLSRMGQHIVDAWPQTLQEDWSQEKWVVNKSDGSEERE